jgi:enoyl-CoA hydratase/carnithine racemase
MPDSLTTLTKLHPEVHLITLSSPPDNRLTPEFLKSLNDNLDAVELEWRERGGGMSPPDPSKKDVKVEGGAVIITGIDRFFSNGLDYVNANKNKRFFEGMLSTCRAFEKGANGQMYMTLRSTG